MGKQACRPRYIAAISPLYLACFPPVSPLTRHHVAARGHQRAAQGGVLRATVEELGLGLGLGSGLTLTLTPTPTQTLTLTLTLARSRSTCSGGGTRTTKAETTRGTRARSWSCALSYRSKLALAA